jgi:hypothetical protein
LLLLGAVLFVTRRPSRSRLEFALAVAALPLVSSISWSFHLVILVLPITLLIRQVFSGAVSRLGGRVLLAAWLCFSVLPAVHYLLIFYPLPHWPGLLDVIPLAVTQLASNGYFIGTVLVAGSLVLLLAGERRIAQGEHPVAAAA